MQSYEKKTTYTNNYSQILHFLQLLAVNYSIFLAKSVFFHVFSIFPPQVVVFIQRLTHRTQEYCCVGYHLYLIFK